jgi:hypothetical protein
MKAIRKPTDYEAAGIDWWNGLTIAERTRWLKHANSSIVAEAYACYLEYLDAMNCKRYVVIINGNGQPAYVFDTETKTKIMSYPTVGEAEHQAKLLNSFIRPDP